MPTDDHRLWLNYMRRLLNADQEDLRSRDWTIPPLDPRWSLQIQERGYEICGDGFWFIAFELKHFGLSKRQSRAWDQDGNLLFAAVPFIDSDLVVYSGTVDQDFAMYRMGTKLAAPFKDYVFTNPGTRWYNIASRIGMKKYFICHSPQILDFFTALIAMRLKEGKRPLLISKKDFRTTCARRIEKGLQELGIDSVKVITSHWEQVDLMDPKVIPLINYGVVGINAFQNFDAVYCLNGYYVNEQIVNSILQDILAPEFEIPIQIGTRGTPLRRWADILNPGKQFRGIRQLVPLALRQQEMDIVLQAVGRVRPYTSPREVITFQCDSHPHLEYTEEFTSLEEAREYFGISKHRDQQKNRNEVRVKEARQRGLTQRQTVEELGLGLRTVKRYWN